MTTLTPTEYQFLIRPYWSDGGDMIKTTIQELCLKNILQIVSKMIFVDKRETKQRKRYFIKLSEYYNPNATYTLAENRIISMFQNKTELSLNDIRKYIEINFKDNSDEFKYKYVLPDLKKKGYFIFPNIVSKNARDARKCLKDKLKSIDKNVDLLIQYNRITSELETLGLNVILLEKETLNKIKEFNGDILHIGILNILKTNNYLNNLDALMSLNSFDMINSIDISGPSVDFGGGDFGGAGGGSGDNW